MNDFIRSLTLLAELGQPLFAVWFMIFVRVGAMVFLLPGFGEQMVPQRVKLAVAMGFSAIVAPAVWDMFPAPFEFSPLFLLAEVSVGLLFGLGLRFFVFALQTAGSLIGQSTSLAQMFGGAAGEAQPVMGNVLMMGALALAMAAGLHVQFAELMIRSYHMFPPGSVLPAADVAEWGMAQVGRCFYLAFSLSAPFVIASLLYHVALGVINRAMPQLMVVFIGAPAMTLGGLVLFALLAPLLLAVWVQALGDFMAQPLGVP